MGIRPNRIKIGIDNGTNVEVLSGLKEGDEVVISTGDKDVKSTAKKTDNGPPGFPF
jgi:multidrug efflux pump subunit AcrA (membrane-fusion protein)